MRTYAICEFWRDSIRLWRWFDWTLHRDDSQRDGLFLDLQLRQVRMAEYLIFEIRELLQVRRLLCKEHCHKTYLDPEKFFHGVELGSLLRFSLNGCCNRRVVHIGFIFVCQHVP